MAKTYTGIDIGSRSVKLAQVRDGVVEKVHVADVPEGSVRDGRIMSPDAMGDFLRQAVQEAGGMSKFAALVVPASSCVVRRVTMPEMTRDELQINLPYEFRDYIAKGLEKYAFDYAVLGRGEDPEAGARVDLMAVAAPLADLRDLTDMIDRAGLRLETALPAQAALQNVISSGAAANDTVCVMDLGHSATELTFFENGRFDVQRSIDMGGAELDRAVADAFDVDYHVGAKYRRTNYQGAATCAGVTAMCDRIAADVVRTLNFYSYNNPSAAVSTVYVTGGEAVDGPLADAVREAVGIDMRPASDLLKFGSKVSGQAGSAVIAAGAASRVGM